MGKLGVQMRALHTQFTELAELTGQVMPRLGAPASPQELARIERHFGAVPPTLRELLATANGWTGVPMYEPPITWFSCDELVSDRYTKFVAKARGTRGFTRDRNMQQGFVFGGSDGAVLLLTPDAAPQIVIYNLRPRAQGLSGEPLHFFASWRRIIGTQIEDARRAQDKARDPSAVLDEAVEAFNYPNEMGEDVHDSVETLRAIVERAADSPYVAVLRLLLAELERGYAGSMRFTVARRRDQTIEVRKGRRWIPIERAVA